MVKQKSIIYMKKIKIYTKVQILFKFRNSKSHWNFWTRTKFVGKSQYKVKFKVINNWIYTVTQITVR